MPRRAADEADERERAHQHPDHLHDGKGRERARMRPVGRDATRRCPTERCETCWHQCVVAPVVAAGAGPPASEMTTSQEHHQGTAGPDQRRGGQRPPAARQRADERPHDRNGRGHRQGRQNRHRSGHQHHRDSDRVAAGWLPPPADDNLGPHRHPDEEAGSQRPHERRNARIDLLRRSERLIPDARLTQPSDGRTAQDIRGQRQRTAALAQVLDEQLDELIAVAGPPLGRIAAHEPPSATGDAVVGRSHARPTFRVSRRSPTSATRRCAAR